MCERFSALEKSVNNLETELHKICEKTRKLEGEVNDLSKSMEFANAEIEDLKKNENENEIKIKELEAKFVPRGVQQAENLRFVVFQKLLTELRIRMKLYVNSLAMNRMEMQNAAIEFQQAHRIGKKKTGETRPVTVRFLEISGT